jgi:hypothetical protein
MSTVQPAPTDEARRRRTRRIAAAVILVLAVAAIIGGVAVWVFFFGTPAPAAPSLDDALQVLLPTAAPGG